MVNENERYEYEVTWSKVPPEFNIVTRKVGHGVIFKINYTVEDEDEDGIEHDRTPRWIHSVDFKSKVSQNCQQLCNVS